MAVTNRGSILISTANDIGSSLVDVIGGEGYTPNEWSKKINLCGIAAADVPTALENIEESTPSGTDRGSISLDTANAVGAVLNKKFNTARGFKPSEWASAISKLTELEVKTASGSVASFDDGADDVPLKSCTCEIVPQQDLHGYANPWAPGAGNNKFNEDWEVGGLNDTTGQPNSDTNKIRSKTFFKIQENTSYYVVAPQSIRVLFYAADESFISETANIKNSTFTTPANAALAKIRGTVDYGTTYNNDIAINYPDSVTTYSPYSNICPITGTTEIEVTHTDGQNPPIESETKTAALGRTVYGGSFSSDGTLTETFLKITDFSALTANGTSSTGAYRYRLNITGLDVYSNARALSNILAFNASFNGASGTFYNSSGYLTIFLDDDNVTDAIATLHNNSCEVVYPLSTPVEHEIEPLPEINSYYGDNNIFSDVQGGTTTVEYRADIDLAAT